MEGIDRSIAAADTPGNVLLTQPDNLGIVGNPTYYLLELLSVHIVYTFFT